MTSENARPQSLQLIRLSLLAGVLMFGGVSVLVHRRPSWTPDVLPPAIDYALVAYTMLAMLVATMLKGRMSRESDPGRRAGLLVAGWAIGEGAGLFGAVIFYLSGQAQWLALGLLAMLGAFILLPIGAASPATGNLDAPRA